MRVQNRTAAALAAATGKGHVGGSDSHSGRAIGRAYTVVDGAATREEFMAGLRAGRGRAEGRHGWYFTMASDMLRFTGRFYEEQVTRLVRGPMSENLRPEVSDVKAKYLPLSHHVIAAGRCPDPAFWRECDGTQRDGSVRGASAGMGKGMAPR